MSKCNYSECLEVAIFGHGYCDKHAIRKVKIGEEGQVIGDNMALGRVTRQEAGGEGVATKDNVSKVRTGLFLVDLAREIWQVCQIIHGGALKYGVRDWQKGKPCKEFFTDAIGRHEIWMNQGQRLDPDTGLPHRAHIIAGHFFELFYENNENKH